jgi:hypothetical protein
MGSDASRNKTVMLASCAAYPRGHIDDVAVVAPLAELGVAATFAVWDDPAVDWGASDLVVLRSTWDYPPRRDRFLAWADDLPHLLNPVDAVRWSSDKRYVRDLVAGGAPCVPTTFVEPGAPAEELDAAIRAVAATAARIVVKPSVGAGSFDAGRFESADGASVELAIKHAGSLVETGRAAMIQPYFDAIDTVGETALIYIEGELSHAIRKEPLLGGGIAAFDGLFAEERVAPKTPSAAERDAAQAVLAAAPIGPGELLYARVDLLAGPDGEPRLLELELVEPSLFMDGTPGAAERFAAAIANRLP